MLTRTINSPRGNHVTARTAEVSGLADGHVRPHGSRPRGVGRSHPLVHATHVRVKDQKTMLWQSPLQPNTKAHRNAAAGASHGGFPAGREGPGRGGHAGPGICLPSLPLFGVPAGRAAGAQRVSGERANEQT